LQAAKWRRRLHASIRKRIEMLRSG